MKIVGRTPKEWKTHVDVETGEDNGRYVNLIIESDDAIATWKRLQWAFIDSKFLGADFSRATIITATGDDGWNDYLLLHHYDTNQTIDKLPEIAG